jgi:hypothetical protein
MRPKNAFAMEMSARDLIWRKVDVVTRNRGTTWKVEPRGKKKCADRCECDIKGIESRHALQGS